MHRTPASLNWLGLAKPPPFPWLYPYQDDGPRLDRIVQRPIVSASLVGTTGEASDGLYALVDSGCAHVLAAPWLAEAAGIDFNDSTRIMSLGIGGATVKVRFSDLSVRLLAPLLGLETGGPATWDGDDNSGTGGRRAALARTGGRGQAVAAEIGRRSVAPPIAVSARHYREFTNWTRESERA